MKKNFVKTFNFSFYVNGVQCHFVKSIILEKNKFQTRLSIKALLTEMSKEEKSAFNWLKFVNRLEPDWRRIEIEYKNEEGEVFSSESWELTVCEVNIKNDTQNSDNLEIDIILESN